MQEIKLRFSITYLREEENKNDVLLFIVNLEKQTCFFSFFFFFFKPIRQNKQTKTTLQSLKKFHMPISFNFN